MRSQLELSLRLWYWEPCEEQSSRNPPSCARLAPLVSSSKKIKLLTAASSNNTNFSTDLNVTHFTLSIKFEPSWLKDSCWSLLCYLMLIQRCIYLRSRHEYSRYIFFLFFFVFSVLATAATSRKEKPSSQSVLVALTIWSLHVVTVVLTEEHELMWLRHYLSSWTSCQFLASIF